MYFYAELQPKPGRADELVEKISRSLVEILNYIHESQNGLKSGLNSCYDCTVKCTF